MITTVSGTMYNDCVRASESFWSSSKPGRYGKGIINTDDDHNKAERWGLIGEQAFGLLVNSKPNLDYVEHGNKTDFNDVLPIEIKTTGMKNKALIVKMNDRGVEQNLTSDVYVVCHLVSEDKDKDLAMVDVVGWLDRADVKRMPESKGKGNWYNYELPFDRLHPIEHLIDVLEMLDRLRYDSITGGK